MMATFIIELTLAAFVLWKYRSEKVTRLVVATLVLLAVFQLAEYNVCTAAFGVDSLTWSKVGYAAITILPALGIHTLSVIARKPNHLLVNGAYALAAAFALFYLTVGHGLTSSVCGGNYVIFEVAPQVNSLYAIYYYGLEIAAAGLAFYYARQTKQPKIKKALYGIMVGYACLLIPTTTVNIIDPETIHGIPSIMCGFAVLLALIVVLYVLPNVATVKHRK